MTTKSTEFTYVEYTDARQLGSLDRELMDLAREATKKAYAPYSNFFVAAVARMDNLQTITGTNQENASFPVGICAERTLLSTISNLCASDSKVVTIAVSYASSRSDHQSADVPISPCGMCRQAICEQIDRQKKDIRLLLSGQTGPVHLIESATSLLPMRFML